MATSPDLEPRSPALLHAVVAALLRTTWSSWQLEMAQERLEHEEQAA